LNIDPKRPISESLLSMFLDHGADATATDLDGSTLLHALTLGFNETIAIRMLIAAGADINAVRERDGETPLITATRQYQVINPTTFHDFNADFNLQDLEGNTALHYACTSWAMENKQVDRWLSFADPTIRNNAGRTAASNFMWGNGGQGRVDALPKMINMGLDLESRDYLGRTLLLQFCSRDHNGGIEHFVRKLLSLGADAKARDYKGKSGK
jgi:ankyrin repeat protein